MISSLRLLLQRRRVARELDDELAFHIEMETQANVARGLSPEDARRQALAGFGAVDRTREAVLEVRSLALDSLGQDVRSAARMLAVTPGFTVTAVAMLALAIGITTAMFTAVDALVLRPVPFRNAWQLAQVSMSNDWGRPSVGVNASVRQAWRASGAFDAVEWAESETALLEVGDTVVSSVVATVTPGVFAMLGGVHPLAGRLFEATEGRPGQRNRVIVSETIWRSMLGVDAAIVDQSVTIDGERLTVVGILPADFRFPSTDTKLWRPIDLAAHRRPGSPTCGSRRTYHATMQCGSRPRLHAQRMSITRIAGFGWVRSLAGFAMRIRRVRVLAFVPGATPRAAAVTKAGRSDRPRDALRPRRPPSQ